MNLLIDLMPNTIGIIAAWKWANNKMEKNKINSQTLLVLNLDKKNSFKLSEERDVPLTNYYDQYC